MFGRATITLGIGPHSSCDLIAHIALLTMYASDGLMLTAKITFIYKLIIAVISYVTYKFIHVHDDLTLRSH